MAERSLNFTTCGVLWDNFFHIMEEFTLFCCGTFPSISVRKAKEGNFYSISTIALFYLYFLFFIYSLIKRTHFTTNKLICQHTHIIICRGAMYMQYRHFSLYLHIYAAGVEPDPILRDPASPSPRLLPLSLPCGGWRMATL